MKKRLEEKLAMFAFGDLSPEETTQLEKEVAGNREAMLVLEEYRGMRSGLKAMGDIPEHQLSTDRLRHAILNQGLKPKSRPQIGWLWMPATAAALAFGIVMVRNANRSVLPAIGPAGGSHEFVVNETPDAFALATASGEILSVANTQPTPAVSYAAIKTAPIRHRRDDRSRIEDLKARVNQEFENLLSANEGIAAEAALDTKSRSAAKPSTSPSGAPIVLIDTAKDSTTGAQKAKEVDSASNVAVGG